MRIVPYLAPRRAASFARSVVVCACIQLGRNGLRYRRGIGNLHGTLSHPLGAGTTEQLEVLNMKLKHWRGTQGIIPCNASPMLEFMFFPDPTAGNCSKFAPGQNNLFSDP